MKSTQISRLADILGEVDRFLAGVLDPILKSVGIGREQWQVLRLLADGEGHPMGEISETIVLPGATTTRMIDRLVAQMLVYRLSDPFDRRRVLVYLAEPGRQLLKGIETALEHKTRFVKEDWSGLLEGRDLAQDAPGGTL